MRLLCCNLLAKQYARLNAAAAAVTQNQCAVIDRVMYSTEYGVNGCYQRLAGTHRSSACAA
jgi:hypothetical protein